jgi:hypothetical protein
MLPLNGPYRAAAFWRGDEPAKCDVALCPDPASHMMVDGRLLCQHHYDFRDVKPPRKGTKCRACHKNQATEFYCPGPCGGFAPMCAPCAKAAGHGFW